MNFKALSTEQMNRISAFWLAQEQKPIFAAVPQLSGIHEDISDAHHSLILYVRPPPPINLALTENRTQAKANDNLHDRNVRASIYLILAAIELAESEEEVKELQGLLDITYPDGFSTTGMTYEEQAGSSDLRRKRLTGEHRAALKKITFQGTDVLTLTETAIDAAIVLGDLERQKRQIEQEIAEENRASSAGEIKRAQYEWIEMAKMVVQHTNRALKKQKITQKQHDDFLEPLMFALQVAEKRKNKPEESENTAATPVDEKATT